MNDQTVAVVGLGYVGLTLAVALSEVGCRTIGVEKRRDIVDMTNNKKPHFSESGLEEALGRSVDQGLLTASENLSGCNGCSCFIITVGTPLDRDGKARLDMIEAATRQVAEVMPEGALVILRSTVKIGTTRKVVKPILDATCRSYHLAMCPERTLEGRAMQELRELPQIVGAGPVADRSRAAEFFRKLTNTVIEVSSWESAEIVKLVDNTYRDVQFGFANEVARLCDAFGVNAYEVISSGKQGYARTNVALPGLVGGPCLEKDPHILNQSAAEAGIELEITRASRLVNERQPHETVDYIAEQIDRRGFGSEPHIAILGLAFKGVPETDDLRGAMSLRVIEQLQQRIPGCRLRVYDPVISQEWLIEEFPEHGVASSIREAVMDAQAVVITNNHPDFRPESPRALYRLMAKDGFIYDYWNNFSNLSGNELKNSYFAVGNTGGVRV